MKCELIKISQNLFTLACLRFVKLTPEPTFAGLGVKIFNTGTSPQGMRTCYLQRLLCKHLENGGRTHWCDTFQGTKLKHWFIFKVLGGG